MEIFERPNFFRKNMHGFNKAPGLAVQIKAEIPLIQCGPYSTTDTTTPATTIITRRMINHFSLLLAYSAM